MHSHEFAEETRRLFKGSGCAPDLTDERLDVLWKTFGNLSLEIWRGTVNRLLLDPYRPTASRIEEAIGIVEEQIRFREVTRRNAEARGIRDRIFSGSTGSAELGQLSAMAGKAASAGAHPGYVADLLDAGLSALSGDDLAFARRWSSTLRDSPNDWHLVSRLQ